MTCRFCHQLLPDDAAYCPSCGMAVEAAATGVTQRLAPQPSQSCPKCGGALEEGFIPDEFRNHSEVTVWVRGVPRRNSVGEVQLDGVEMWIIRTSRCTVCGYLESYADAKLADLE